MSAAQSIPSQRTLLLFVSLAEIGLGVEANGGSMQSCDLAQLAMELISYEEERRILQTYDRSFFTVG